MHERELFVRSSAAAGRPRRPFECAPFVPFGLRPFEPVGMRDGAVCEGVWGRRSYRSGPVAR